MEVNLEVKKRDKNERPSHLRREGWVPGCVYGKNIDPVSIKVPYHKLKECLGTHVPKVQVVLDGKKKFLVGVEEVQRGHLQDKLLHVSLHVLSQDEKSTLHVPLHFVGKAKGQFDGGILKEQLHEIVVKGFPADLPDKIEVDVSELELGSSIYVKDLKNGEKYEFSHDDLEKVLVSCNHPRVQKVPEQEVVEESVETPETLPPEASDQEKKDAA